MSHPKNAGIKKFGRLPLILAASLPLTAGLVFASAVSGQAPERLQPLQVALSQPAPLQPAPTEALPGAGAGPQRGPQGQHRQQPGTTPTARTNYADVFFKNLAAQLGVTVDKLRSAAVTAGNSTVDQGVKAGDFPNDAAQRMKVDLQQNPFKLAAPGRPGEHGGPEGRAGHKHGQEAGPAGQKGDMGPRGMRRAGGPVLEAAVARSLGLSEAALMQELQGGKTIADVAKARGVSTATVHAAVISALQTQLAAEVKAGRLEQAQATRMIQRAQSDANFGLSFGHRPGGPRGGEEGRPLAPAPTPAPKGQLDHDAGKSNT